MSQDYHPPGRVAKEIYLAGTILHSLQTFCTVLTTSADETGIFYPSLNEGDDMRIGMLFAIFLMPGLISAQQVVRRTLTPDNSVVIFEIGAVITAEDGQLTVLDVMDPSDLPDGAAAVDIQSGDRVMIFNGKKVETIKDLRAAYDVAEAGKTSKLGFKRGENLLVVEFKQLSPGERPQKVMIRKRH
jgi:S1-C subfamily serine protease